jgi:hypothetical protein
MEVDEVAASSGVAAPTAVPTQQIKAKMTAIPRNVAGELF